MRKRAWLLPSRCLQSSLGAGSTESAECPWSFYIPFPSEQNQALVHSRKQQYNAFCLLKQKSRKINGQILAGIRKYDQSDRGYQCDSDFHNAHCAFCSNPDCYPNQCFQSDLLLLNSTLSLSLRRRRMMADHESFLSARHIEIQQLDSTFMVSLWLRYQ